MGEASRIDLKTQSSLLFDHVKVLEVEHLKTDDILKLVQAIGREVRNGLRAPLALCITCV